MESYALYTIYMSYIAMMSHLICRFPFCFLLLKLEREMLIPEVETIEGCKQPLLLSTGWSLDCALRQLTRFSFHN